MISLKITVRMWSLYYYYFGCLGEDCFVSFIAMLGMFCRLGQSLPLDSACPQNLQYWAVLIVNCSLYVNYESIILLPSQCFYIWLLDAVQLSQLLTFVQLLWVACYKLLAACSLLLLSMELFITIAWSRGSSTSLLCQTHHMQHLSLLGCFWS